MFKFVQISMQELFLINVMFLGQRDMTILALSFFEKFIIRRFFEGFVVFKSQLKIVHCKIVIFNFNARFRKQLKCYM